MISQQECGRVDYPHSTERWLSLWSLGNTAAALVDPEFEQPGDTGHRETSESGDHVPHCAAPGDVGDEPAGNGEWPRCRTGSCEQDATRRKDVRLWALFGSPHVGDQEEKWADSSSGRSAKVGRKASCSPAATTKHAPIW
jgi:hypothetical protein